MNSATALGGRTFLSLATALLLVLLPSTSEASSSCDSPITTDVVMTEEVLECWNGEIRGDDIVVDLNEVTVEATPITAFGRGITVRNGTLDAKGLQPNSWEALNAFQAPDLTIDGVTIRNHPGIALQAGTRTTVQNSEFRGNGVAIEQFHGRYLTVRRNLFAENGTGVLLHGGQNDHIVGNRFVDNRYGVKIPLSDFSPSRTVISSNHFDGHVFAVYISAAHDANAIRIEKNTIRRSEASGIAIVANDDLYGDDDGDEGGGQDSQVRENVIIGSGRSPRTVTACADVGALPTSCSSTTADDGITIIAARSALPPSISVGGNRTIRNAGSGIEAPGVTDSGKNVAAANGSAPQCVGVVCPGRR